MEVSEERIMPHSLEAEQAVLGAVLQDNEALGEIVGFLRPEDFYSQKYQWIYEQMLTLVDRSEAVDPVTLQEALSRQKLLEKVGGSASLVELIERVPTAAHAEHYGRIVSEKARVRRLIRAAQEILRWSGEFKGPVAELIDLAEREVYDVSRREHSSSAVPLDDLLKKTFADIDNLQSRQGRLTGLATGFDELDDLLCGMQNGELLVVAARPSMGKTTFALNVAMSVGVNLQQPAVFFSLEMSRGQLAQNILCSYARVDSHRMRRGFLGEQELPRLALACGKLSEARIFIDDTSALTVTALRAKARRLKSRHDIKLIMVDYLQLMDAPRAENRQQEISQISRGLKAVARELNVPVVVLSQLNRGVENREGNRPRMSDLRESGSIEQDADVVILLHREDYFKKETPNPGVAEIIVAKQRNGPTATVKLAYLKHLMRFENLAAIPEPEA